MRFIICFVLISHILSCFWIFLAIFENENWISNSKMDFVDNSDIYVVSLYFIWSTIFTIGYGDIISVNIYERCFNIIIMQVGVLLFSFAVLSLCIIVTSYDKMTELYMHNLNVLDEIREYNPQIDILEKRDRIKKAKKNTTILKLYMTNYRNNSKIN